MKKLSTKQNEAIEMLLVGESDAKISKALRLNRGTLYLWQKKNLTFMQELETRKVELEKEHKKLLEGIFIKALQIISKELEHGNVKVALNVFKACYTQEQKEKEIEDNIPLRLFSKNDDLELRLKENTEIIHV